MIGTTSCHQVVMMMMMLTSFGFQFIFRFLFASPDLKKLYWSKSATPDALAKGRVKKFMLTVELFGVSRGCTNPALKKHHTKYSMCTYSR